MSEDLIPKQIILLVSIIGSLFSIYASSYVGGVVLPLVAVSLSALLGTNTLRHVAKYSLGTGVPSIVYMLTACGLLSYLFALSLSIKLNNSLIFPILAILIVIIISASISVICKKILKIEVDILLKSFIQISVASVLTLISFSTLITTVLDVNIIFNEVVSNALIILLMFITIMTIQNPYNSCMGPNEDQYRTLSLALANVFLMSTVVIIISSLNNSLWLINLIICIISWIILFRKYCQYSLRQAANVKYYGLWSNNDEGDY